MAYEIGTATDYRELLLRLKDFISNPARAIASGDTSISELSPQASGEGWTIERWDTNFDADGGYEMIANGPGASGVDEIFTGIQTYYHAGDDYYNWKLNGMTGFVSGQTMQLQPGSVQGCWPKLLMWDDPIDYWFLANGRRYVVIAKVSTSYEMLYQGFALPYGLPTQFPYPLVVGGSFSDGAGAPRYSSVEAEHRGFPNPDGDGAEVCTGAVDADASDRSSLKILQGTSWIKTANRTSLTVYGSTNTVWPYCSSTYSTSGGDDMPYNIFSTALRENLDGSYPIFPLIVMMQNPNNNIFGELQGCFAVPGFGGIAAEDTFTINGDTYIAFPIAPNADRADFMCIKKE